MEFAFRPAAISGAIGGVIMVMMGKLMNMAGVNLQMSVVLMWGGMLGLRGAPGRLVGWIVHLVVSAAIGVAYAGIFRLAGATRLAGLWGLSIGVIHWIFAGFFLGVISVIRPAKSGKRPAPGPFAVNFGLDDVVAFLIAHLVFGTVVGVLYPRLARRATRAR